MQLTWQRYALDGWLIHGGNDPISRLVRLVILRQRNMWFMEIFISNKADGDISMTYAIIFDFEDLHSCDLVKRTLLPRKLENMITIINKVEYNC